jgi:hypothetical protein
VTRMDPRLENYDRGEPLGSVHCQPSLAACKARAIRAVAAAHFDDFEKEMKRLGWQYMPDGEFSLDAISGRPKQWVRCQP